jgi:hypothetical protein
LEALIVRVVATLQKIRPVRKPLSPQIPPAEIQTSAPANQMGGTATKKAARKKRRLPVSVARAALQAVQQHWQATIVILERLA